MISGRTKAAEKLKTPSNNLEKSVWRRKYKSFPRENLFLKEFLAA
jgi:hypothetical protein